MRNTYDSCNYDQRRYQNRYRSDSRDRKIHLMVECSVDKIIKILQGMNRTIGMTLEEVTSGEI